jgi:uncharacterized membrane protein
MVNTAFNIKNIKYNKHNVMIAGLLIFISIISFCFISTNEIFYKEPIAKIVSIKEDISSMEAMEGKVEQIKKQHIEAVIMNGNYKGKRIKLENEASFSQVNDTEYKTNDEVFILIQTNSKNEIVSSKIIDLKRDKYIVYTIIIFVLLISLIGGIKGFRSLVSVIINLAVCYVIVQMILNNYNLIFICIAASILFISLSIAIVGGINKKTLAALIATIAATAATILIAVLVIKLNNWNGIHFEEMEFLTRPPEGIFIIEILIGTFGAIIDITISISSSINELLIRNPQIDRKTLIMSGVEIGRDILGAMTNTLVLAYISGSIPTILLMLRNGFPISYITDIDLSLEIVRALTGSIGIVISIPISIYISTMLMRDNKIGELKI